MSGMQHSMAYIKVDGRLLPTLPGAKLNMGGKKRDPVVGDNAIHGFSQKLEPATLECEISLGEGFSLQQMGAIVDATITYEADTGQTYIVRSAFCSDTVSVTAGDGGKVALKFQGQPAEEMVS